MSKIPFKVSARVARLIGRENVANAEGAIIELVKNAYDADATICIIFFDNSSNVVPESLTEDDYKSCVTETAESGIIELAYQKVNSNYILSLERTDEAFAKLRSFFGKLYIIDNGVGMNDKVIENHWMQIGTNYKVDKYKSEKNEMC